MTRSYHGRPVLKEPVWTWEVPCYFFVGGLAGASAPLALAAQAAGNRPLERRAWLTALAGAAVSPALLVSDLGRPERFLHMLRMVKPTSPMSLGAWALTVFGAATGLAAARSLLGRFPRAGAGGGVAAALVGPTVATYTGALVANTAIPAWHEARRELPFLFAGSAMAAAGSAGALLTPRAHAGPARRLAVLGAGLELAAAAAMERRLGDLAAPYRRGEAARFRRPAQAFTAAGAALLAGRRHRAAGAVGAGSLLAGSLLQRWAVYRAGVESARDPDVTVGPQRARIRSAAPG